MDVHGLEMANGYVMQPIFTSAFWVLSRVSVSLTVAGH